MRQRSSRGDRPAPAVLKDLELIICRNPQSAIPCPDRSRRVRRSTLGNRFTNRDCPQRMVQSSRMLSSRIGL
jgi:hypothetical protein